MMSVGAFIPFFLVFVKILLILGGGIFLLSGLDDLFIDLYHMTRSLYRRLFVMPKHQPLTEDQLLLPSEQAIAIMIPAWDESSVIGRMLENTLQTLNYSNYHIFVGTYPNDTATQRVVETVRERFDIVHRIVCPKDGPTNKADCLNWIYQGISRFEKEQALHFGMFVVQDSEDIIHPLSLKLFNYLIPRKDMVQLPVFPLEGRWYHFTSGHYMDEFAENHSKDLVVREFLGRSIPSAGVGCAFSRRALNLVAGDNRNQLFNIDSLTEDYDFGFRLREYGLKQIFVRHAIERTITQRHFWSRQPRHVRAKEYVATREHFPATCWAAVRQKSRWIVGIAMQGWTNLGWRGDGRTKYMLFRDRKALITNQVNMLGYVIVVTVLALWITNWLDPDSYRYPPLVEIGSWLWYVILVNSGFLVLRLLQRAFNVQRIYGWQQAFLSLPRQIWGNVVNFLAVGRAIYLFTRYLMTGKLIAWDKTDHVFPSEAQLMAYRRKLGDLFLEKRFITVKQLDEALTRQKEVNRPLGALLVEMGLVREEDVIQILGLQLQMSTREIDPYDTPLELLELFPRHLAVQYSVFPVELRRAGRLVVATNNPFRREQVEQLEQTLDRPIEVCLATRSDVAFAIQRGYERLERSEDEAIRRSRLGQLLLERRLITEAQLRQALKAQRRGYARLGDILTEEGMISPETLQEALSQYSISSRGRLGDFLVQNNYITLDQLERALQVQSSRFRRLGDVLIDLGMIFGDSLEQVLMESPREA